MFDIVFTVNNFFYWKDTELALQEVYRVLRPGALFLSSFQPNGLKSSKKKKTGTGKINSDLTTSVYMGKLQDCGFVKIQAEEHRNATSGCKYQIIKAYKRKTK